MHRSPLGHVQKVGVLQHDFGQAIITAAFVDDILSLVLFNILFSLTGDFDAMNTIIKPIVGAACVLSGVRVEGFLHHSQRRWR